MDAPSSMSPNFSNFSKFAVHNDGAGPQNVADRQYNNNADGTQFVNSNFYGVGFQDHRANEAERIRQEKEACLRSLSFPRRNARYHDIELAHSHTCDWLFETPEFQRWRDLSDLPTHNGVLWIKGKPGTGKSTLMKHTLRHCQKAFNDHLIVAYFFNARGEILEKTPDGLWRSVVYQFLDKDATLFEDFLRIFRETQREYKEGGWEWRPSQLKDFVGRVIRDWRSKPILLLVDALDECSEDGVRDVVRFLETLSIDALRSRVTLRICLSSRHYPHISMKKVLELTVEKDEAHRRDIATYVEDMLRIRHSYIEAQINWKADGIFLWVVIVVSQLNRAYDEGRVEAMQKALDEVPDNLEEVFNALLGKDDPDKAKTILMLQWVLFSQQLLKPEELFHVVVGTALPTSDIIQRRITTLSKGLIEVRKGDTTTMQSFRRPEDTASVQFIHLSVSDFLLRNKRLQTLDQTLEPDPISASHHRLWASCWLYIEPLVTTLPTKQQIEKLIDNYPFLSYAVSCIFYHANKALFDPSGTSERRGAIGQWLQKHDDWFQWCCTITDALGDSRFISHLQRVRGGGGLLYRSSSAGYQNLVRALLAQELIDVNAQGGNMGNALQAASFGGNEEIVRLLLEKGADINAQGGRYGNALQAAAALNGNEEIVRLLLEKGADVNAQGGNMGNALQAAAALNRNEEIVRLLLEKGADVNAQGGNMGNALQAASFGGNEEIVRLLLEKGADINAQGGRYGNALQAAAALNGNKEIVRLLLEKGADVNAQGGTYGNALQAASFGRNRRAIRANATRGGYEETIRLLLEKGADVNAQGGTYLKRREVILRLLIEKDANVDT